MRVRGLLLGIQMTTVVPIVPTGRLKKKLKFTPETKCGYCTGSKCCNYITQQIDTPRARGDFDVMLWQMAHGNVEYYKDCDGWFLMVNTTCKFLQGDGRCGIYETRPQICREYSNDFCEYDEPPEKHFDLYFRNYDELLGYCKTRFKTWGKTAAS